ncbi:hypothetical protein, partial [Oceanithermus sp.]|uniref:hypothetical protein n=1 Tax=Oceanithermus sp. TaxID=2268145 RepID=UPI0025D42BE0
MPHVVELRGQQPPEVVYEGEEGQKGSEQGVVHPRQGVAPRHRQHRRHPPRRREGQQAQHHPHEHAQERQVQKRA